MKTAILTIILALLFLGCEDQGAVLPRIPKDAVAFDPPAIFKQYWAQVEECSGVTGDFSQVKWMYTGSPIAVYSDGLTSYGDAMWDMASNTIVFVQSQYIVAMADSGLVRHEMLHALLHDPTHQAWVKARCFAELAGSTWNGGY